MGLRSSLTAWSRAWALEPKKPSTAAVQFRCTQFSTCLICSFAYNTGSKEDLLPQKDIIHLKRSEPRWRIAKVMVITYESITKGSLNSRLHFVCKTTSKVTLVPIKVIKVFIQGIHPHTHPSPRFLKMNLFYKIMTASPF